MIANLQEHSCNSIANRIFANAQPMDGNEKDRALIQSLSDWAKMSPSEVARKAGLAVSTLTRPLNQPVKYSLSRPTLEKLRAKYPTYPGWAGEEADQPDSDPNIAYVPIEVLPTYAGMGGGGTGEGDVEMALVPRYLIEQVFRGQPSDFVLIRVRGNSMEPTFHHDDELLVDKRDTSPTQPGPFAIWDAEWEEYLVKNVERMQGGIVRLFPSNSEFSAVEIRHEETKILGRPVWFGRRL